MFIRCSRFLSLIFPPTVYHGHVLLPLLLGNKQIIWSVAAHETQVGTCLNTRVCLTQHPSDTLRLFWELNYRTLYCTILKNISSYEPPSHLLPSLVNSVLSYPHYSWTILANTALGIHLTACLPYVGWPAMGYVDHCYPNWWIGHFCPQAWPAWSPALTPGVGRAHFLRDGLPAKIANEKSYWNESWSPLTSLTLWPIVAHNLCKMWIFCEPKR